MLFRKQADNLKTNHTGTFVIQDNRFRFLNRVSQVSDVCTRGNFHPITLRDFIYLVGVNK